MGIMTHRPCGLPTNRIVLKKTWFCKELKQKRLNCVEEVKHGITPCKRTAQLFGFLWGFPKQGAPENPKARRHTARLLKNMVVWAAVLCTKSTQYLYWDIVNSDGISGHNSPQHAASATSVFFWVVISANVSVSHLAGRYLCLGFRLACFAAGGAGTKQLLCVTTSRCKSSSV